MPKTVFLFLLLFLLAGCASSPVRIFSTDTAHRDKLQDYLYRLTDISHDLSAVEKRLSDYPIPYVPSGDAIRKGPLCGRNFHWLWEESSSYLLQTKAAPGRHAILGVAHLLKKTDEKPKIDFTEETKFNPRELWDITCENELLSFLMTDGINDAGLFCCLNAVPEGDQGKTTGTNPAKERLSILATVRFLLDGADSVEHAIALLQSRNIYAPKGFEGHLMIADKQRTVIVEFFQNRMKITENARAMTNYYLCSNLTPLATGIERLHILSGNWHRCNSRETMIEVLQKTYYTRLYDPATKPVWYSEFNGDYRSSGGPILTIHSPREAYDTYLKKVQQMFPDKERNRGFWHTQHTAVYNLDSLTMTLMVQEHPAQYQFELPKTSNSFL